MSPAHITTTRMQELPSNRSFGITFGVVFALIGAIGWWKGAPRAWAAVAISLAFFVLGLVAPGVLRPLNVVWMRLAGLMNRVVSPVVLAVIFYGVVTPYAAALRLMGRDLL